MVESGDASASPVCCCNWTACWQLAGCRRSSFSTSHSRHWTLVQPPPFAAACSNYNRWVACVICQCYGTLGLMIVCASVKGGCALLVISHHLADMQMADHVVMLEHGHVVWQGAPPAGQGSGSATASPATPDAPSHRLSQLFRGMSPPCGAVEGYSDGGGLSGAAGKDS